MPRAYRKMSCGESLPGFFFRDYLWRLSVEGSGLFVEALDVLNGDERWKFVRVGGGQVEIEIEVEVEVEVEGHAGDAKKDAEAKTERAGDFSDAGAAPSKYVRYALGKESFLFVSYPLTLTEAIAFIWAHKSCVRLKGAEAAELQGSNKHCLCKVQTYDFVGSLEW